MPLRRNHLPALAVEIHPLGRYAAFVLRMSCSGDMLPYCQRFQSGTEDKTCMSDQWSAQYADYKACETLIVSSNGDPRGCLSTSSTANCLHAGPSLVCSARRRETRRSSVYSRTSPPRSPASVLVLSAQINRSAQGRSERLIVGSNDDPRNDLPLPFSEMSAISSRERVSSRDQLSFHKSSGGVSRFAHIS